MRKIEDFLPKESKLKIFLKEQLEDVAKRIGGKLIKKAEDFLDTKLKKNEIEKTPRKKK